jgi:hypothetical protein
MQTTLQIEAFVTGQVSSEVGMSGARSMPAEIELFASFGRRRFKKLLVPHRSSCIQQSLLGRRFARGRNSAPVKQASYPSCVQALQTGRLLYGSQLERRSQQALSIVRLDQT